MSSTATNPVLDALREIAMAMPNAEEGEVLSRLKLVDSFPEAEELAAKDEARYSAGKGGWVTVRLSPTGRLPKKLQG